MTTRFWMVCARPTHPAARTEPKARYDSLPDAREAARLLADQTDRTFCVLGVVEIICPQDSATPTLI